MAKLPEEFVLETRRLMGEERFNRYLEAFNEEAPTSIRLNPRISQGVKRGHLAADLSPCEVPWCEEGYYLNGRPQFTFDPLFHAGCYYVQEASSMFISHVLRHLVKESVDMLDLCAGSWWKIDCCQKCAARRKYTCQQRTDTNQSADPLGKHHEMGLARHDGHQQLSP